MFRPDSFAAGAGERLVFLNGRVARRVGFFEVRFTVAGMRLIGEGILAVAGEFGLPEGLVRLRMKGNLFAVPPSPSLYFLFHLPEIEADMHIEIPPVYWSLATDEPAV